MFGKLGVPELLIILVIVLLIFGAGKIPEVMGSLGKGLREFRKTSRVDDEEKPKVEERPPIPRDGAKT